MLPHLSFGDDLDSNSLTLDLPLLRRSQARIPEMPPPHLFPELILGSEVLPIPEALIQRRLLCLSRNGLGDAPLLGLLRAQALGERRLDVLGGRQRREGTAKESPRGGPGRRGGGPGGKGAG